jgi:hypothetical protein
MYGYEYAASNNWLGEAERERYLDQSESKIGIMGGRSEFAAAIMAIADSPLLGHGSWAKDIEGYRLKGADLLGIRIPRTTRLHYRDMLIPGHSHIWGPWIWHGLLGGLFWIYVIIFVAKSFLICAHEFPDYLPFTIAVAMQFFWDILFSPFGQRPLQAAYLVFFILISERALFTLRGQLYLPKKATLNVATPG